MNPSSTVGYIYCLRDPRTNRVHYVGQTIYPDAREIQHASAKTLQSIGKHKWTLELRRLGLRPAFEILEELDHDGDFSLLSQREIHWIKHFVEAGEHLYNRPAGAIREQDIISTRDWKGMHIALTDIRNEVLGYGTFFKNAIRNTSKEARAADKALKALDELRWLLEERFSQ